jgi:hypothetical protein
MRLTPSGKSGARTFQKHTPFDPITSKGIPLQRSIHEIAALRPETRTKAESDKLRFAFLDRAAPKEIRRARDELRTVQKARQQFWESIRTVMVMAEGGGIKPGITPGETDDYCYNITKDPVHVHDLQATILQCLGIDHTRLTYKFQGRHFRLTDIAGNVVKNILA